LLGGWAVHLHVNPRFQKTEGRNYIGSRDIDIGLHVNPDWNPIELQEGSVGRSLQRIQKLGYNRSRFGYVQNFIRETGERISEEEAGDLPMHEVFQVYIDTIPDTEDLDNFREAFGFKPPAETLLKPVFEKDVGEPLTEYVDWNVPDSTVIVPVEVLAAMKIRSIPRREKSHKRVKDIADLHSLLWYTNNFQQIIQDTKDYATASDLETLSETVDPTLFEAAANLLRINPSIVKDSIQRLTESKQNT